MRVEASVDPVLSRTAASARAVEDAGFDGILTAEVAHDPFLACTIAAEHTSRVSITTCIALAFARNPMNVAYLADDLQRFSGGRFELGLGSQVRPHIERRFSMPWSEPAARMREYVRAVRAIWSAWADGAQVDFRGDFYQHTLMPPFFSPGPNSHGPPKVLLAGVGTHMTRVAGEVADGFLSHGFTTERYLRERCLPALAEGRATVGASLDGFDLLLPVLVVTGGDDEAVEAARQGTKAQIAFYGSTPGYRSVLELHGWGDLQPELHALSRNGGWDQMATLVDDEVLEAFAVVAEPDKVAASILDRFGDVATRVNLYTPYAADPELIIGIAGELAAA